jgi:hypothetical protein
MPYVCIVDNRSLANAPCLGVDGAIANCKVRGVQRLFGPSTICGVSCSSASMRTAAEWSAHQACSLTCWSSLCDLPEMQPAQGSNNQLTLTWCCLWTCHHPVWLRPLQSAPASCAGIMLYRPTASLPWSTAVHQPRSCYVQPAGRTN